MNTNSLSEDILNKIKQVKEKTIFQGEDIECGSTVQFDLENQIAIVQCTFYGWSDIHGKKGNSVSVLIAGISPYYTVNNTSDVIKSVEKMNKNMNTDTAIKSTFSEVTTAVIELKIQ